jgi:type VI secretion system protein ImpK
MAEESKQSFDPDATVAQPLANADPDATLPVVLAKKPSPEEDTFKGPAFDPDKTFNPAEKASLDDPEATIRIAPSKPKKKNPFAPRALPESLQANLAALGGINPLVALANPILGAVPEIRHMLKHRDPALLRKSLVDQVRAFRMKAEAAGVAQGTVEDSVYALGALLDDAASFTPWGHDWSTKGVLQELLQKTDGADTLVARLEKISNNAAADASLLELYYICLALGFEGRYRNAPNGRRELGLLNDRIYSAVARHRPRPVDGLSERWRSPLGPQPAPAPAPAAKTSPPPARSFHNMPRQAKLAAILGGLATLVVIFLLALRLSEDDGRDAVSSRNRVAGLSATPQAAPDPSAAAAASLQAALAGEAVDVTGSAGRVSLALRDNNQYGSGAVSVKPALKPLLAKIGKALESVPGAVVVAGYSDSTPIQSGGVYASNQALSLARAQSAAREMAAALSDKKRVSAEGKGDAEPLAPGDGAAERAKNRRVVISLQPAP